METSYFIARVFGSVLLALGLGLLFNADHYRKVFKQFIGEETLYFLSGWIAFPLGMVLVLHHNVWQGPWWVVALSLLSWWIMIKGALLLIAPQWLKNMGKAWLKNEQLLIAAGLIYLALGAAFSYYGFFA